MATLDAVQTGNVGLLQAATVMSPASLPTPAARTLKQLAATVSHRAEAYSTVPSPFPSCCGSMHDVITACTFLEVKRLIFPIKLLLHDIQE